MTELLRFILFDMHRLIESKTNLQITDSDGSSLKSLGEVLGEHAVEVDVTVFGARGEAEAVGVEGDGVDGTEMAFDVGQHFVVNNIVQLDVEAIEIILQCIVNVKERIECRYNEHPWIDLQCWQVLT